LFCKNINNVPVVTIHACHQSCRTLPVLDFFWLRSCFFHPLKAIDREEAIVTSVKVVMANEAGTLHGAVFSAWKKTNVAFNERDAEDWLHKKPASDSAKDVLDWAGAHPFVKVVAADVPSGIVEGKHAF